MDFWRIYQLERRNLCRKRFQGHELSNVRFLERRALPLQRGKAGEINSNFNQLYYFWAKDNPFVNDLMKRKGDKYTSRKKWWRLWCCRFRGKLQQKLVVPIFFTIMVDEGTVVANISHFRIRGVDMNMRTFDYFWVNSSEVTVIIWGNFYKTSTCGPVMVGVLPMPLWKHLKVLELMSFDLFWVSVDTCQEIRWEQTNLSQRVVPT